MRVKLRLGVRLGFAGTLALALLFGFVSRGGARIVDVSTVTIGDAAPVVEGGTASFPITISPAASQEFTFTVQSSESDQPAVLVDVQPDESSTTVAIPTDSNSTPQDDRSFTATIQDDIQTTDGVTDPTTVATVGSSNVGNGEIIDDDWEIGPIVTTPGSPTVSEAGGNTIGFQVSLQDSQGNAYSAPQNHAITVDYSIADGSAKLGKNYSITSPSNGHATGTLTFAPGTSSVGVQIKSIDDGVYSNNTTFSVTFQSAQGATLSSGQPTESATGTITEADPAPYMGISSCQGSPISGGSVATFPILLAADSPTNLTASVDYTTVDDSTIAGDYTAVTGTATIAPGKREFDLQVQTAQNPPSGNRSFHIQLSNAQNVRLLDTSASCTIVSTAVGGGSGGSGNGGSVTITNPKPVTQPTSGSTSVSVPLSLTLPNPLPTTPGPVTVQWKTVDGSATAPTDYTAASGTVTWPAATSGASPTPVTINVNPDPAVTQPVSFTVAFTSSDATFVGNATATVTIVPAGSTTPLLSIADDSVASQAGSAPVTVTMTPAATQPVTVAYATANGTGANGAIAGTNYTATSGTLTFAPGVATKTINVPILPNTSTQPNRDFTISLSNPTGGGVIAVGSATITILNDFYVAPLPPIVGSGTRIQQQPTQVRTAQKPTTQTHAVLVQLYTGTAKVSAKGIAAFQIGCPFLAVLSCKGTATLEVGVKQKVKGKSVVKTVRVANGVFSLAHGARAMLNAKLTAAGLKLLATYKRMQVKVTLTSKDGSGATGATAWLATLQAPAAKSKAKPAAKPKSKTKKSKTKKSKTK